MKKDRGDESSKTEGKQIIKQCWGKEKMDTRKRRNERNRIDERRDERSKEEKKHIKQERN